MNANRTARPHRRALPALALVGAMALVGCGDGDGKSSTADTEAAAATDPPAETDVPDTEAPAATEVPVDTEAPVETEAPAPTEPVDTAAPVESERWVAPSGDYSVIFPDGEEPVSAQETVPVVDTTLDVEFFVVERPTFAVSAAQFDYSTLDGDYVVDLQGAVDGATGNIAGGTLVSSTELTIDGRDAIEYEFTFDGGVGRSLVVDSDGDVIQLQALGLDDGDYDSFIDTFEFTGEAE